MKEEERRRETFVAIEKWWLDTAAEEVMKVVPKAVEYGATDLADIGFNLARAANRQVGEEEAAELGIYFYCLGKMARWTDAIKRGDRCGATVLMSTSYTLAYTGLHEASTLGGADFGDKSCRIRAAEVTQRGNNPRIAARSRSRSAISDTGVQRMSASSR